MVTSVLRVLVNNPFKESFYEKKFNVLIVFFISYKSNVKIFLKSIINQYLKGTRLAFPMLNKPNSIKIKLLVRERVYLLFMFLLFCDFVW